MANRSASSNTKDRRKPLRRAAIKQTPAAATTAIIDTVREVGVHRNVTEREAFMPASLPLGRSGASRARLRRSVRRSLRQETVAKSPRSEFQYGRPDDRLE